MAESGPGTAAGALVDAPAGDIIRPGVDPNAVYALGSSGGESARLQRQADELEPESGALLDRVGVGLMPTFMFLAWGRRSAAG